MICVSALKGAAFLTTWNVAPLPPTHTNTLLTEAKLYFSWVSLRACLLISALPLFFSALESLFLLTVRKSLFLMLLSFHMDPSLSVCQHLSVCLSVLALPSPFSVVFGFSFAHLPSFCSSFFFILSLITKGARMR